VGGPDVGGLQCDRHLVDEAVQVQELAPVVVVVGVDAALEEHAPLAAVDDLLFDELERLVRLSEQTAGVEDDATSTSPRSTAAIIAANSTRRRFLPVCFSSTKTCASSTSTSFPSAHLRQSRIWSSVLC
jgi:hypothetical protein